MEESLWRRPQQYCKHHQDAINLGKIHRLSNRHRDISYINQSTRANTFVCTSMFYDRRCYSSQCSGKLIFSSTAYWIEKVWNKPWKLKHGKDCFMSLSPLYVTHFETKKSPNESNSHIAEHFSKLFWRKIYIEKKRSKFAIWRKVATTKEKDTPKSHWVPTRARVKVVCWLVIHCFFVEIQIEAAEQCSLVQLEFCYAVNGFRCAYRKQQF